MSIRRKQSLLVAKALREYAELLVNNADNVSVEQGQALDRALRSCEAIIDIDPVWVTWRYVAAQRGWLTTKELVFTGKCYMYPKDIYKDAEAND